MISTAGTKKMKFRWPNYSSGPPCPGVAILAEAVDELHTKTSIIHPLTPVGNVRKEINTGTVVITILHYIEYY